MTRFMRRSGHPRRWHRRFTLPGLSVLLTMGYLVFSLLQAQAAPLDYLPEQAHLFQQALTAARLSPSDVRFAAPDLTLWGANQYRLNLLDVFFDQPWKISAYTRALADNLLESDTDLARLVFNAHRRLDPGLNPQLNRGLPTPVPPEPPGEADLARVLSQITGEAIATFETPAYATVPLPLRTAVAQFLRAVPDILSDRQVGLLQPLAQISSQPSDLYAQVLDFAIRPVAEEPDPDSVTKTSEQILLIESLLNRVDFKFLNTGAIITASALQELQQQLSQVPAAILAGRYDYSVDTPLGRLVLRGQGDHVYPEADYLLIVDGAGQDTYDGGGGSSLAQGLSVIVDLAGNDRYESHSNTRGSFGAGLFGYGVLLDLAGDDTYVTDYASQGMGLFGTGLLYDTQGDDRYQGLSYLQGSGLFGTGILADRAGSDRYALYRYGQGFGFTRGAGLLLDRAGDDQYIGLADRYANGGPFGADRHVQFIQGAGYGRRGEDQDGHSWAGGLGLLVDGEGNDRYDCDIYGQGTGYWYGLGLLVDKAGNDSHRSGAYSLAGAPHFSIGIVQDDGGDDTYKVELAQSLGQGRDWSIGWFEESAGNDWYQGSHGILGSGDVNGIGVFWDKQGDDTYLTLAAPAYGQATIGEVKGLRELMLTLGLFVDGSGQDQYRQLPPTYQSNQIEADVQVQTLQSHPDVGNNRLWCRPTLNRAVKGAYGCGVDRN